MSKLRVTMVGSWPPTPGISAYCLHLAHALHGKVHLKYVTFSKMYPDALYPGGAVPRDDSFPMQLADGVDVHASLAWYNPLSWVAAGWKAKNRLLHVQVWSLPLVPVFFVMMLVARLRSAKCVITAHNLEGHERRTLYRTALNSLMLLSHAVVVHPCRYPAWVGVACRRWTGREPIVIPHGPLALFATTTSVSSARASLDIPEDAEVALFFGSIREYKGLDVLLEAFGAWASGDDRRYLVIAGRLWEPWEPYADLIGKHDWGERVRTILDYIPTANVGDYFQAADVVVLPYRSFEAQSGVGLTAIGVRRPLIVTRVGGLEELQPDPALVAEPGDVPSLAQALRLFFEDAPRRHRAVASADALARKMSWEEIARLSIELYDSLDGRSQQAP